MNWYARQTRFLKRRFGKDWKLVAGLLAATSPRVKLGVSWDWSMAIYDAVIEEREPDLSTLFPCHKANVKRVLNGQELSGDKVRRFYLNLIGDLEVVTIDTWMIKLWKIDCGTHGSPWPAMYRRLERVFQRWAGSKGMKPANAQAILWNYIRKKEGRKPVSFAMIEEASVPF